MKRIYIWGIGEKAQNLISLGMNCKISGFIQTKKTNDIFYDLPVLTIEEIPRNNIVILVANCFSDQVYDACIENHIDLDNVIFLIKGEKTSFKTFDGLREILGEKNYTNYLAEYGNYKDSFFEKDIDKYSKLNRRANFDIKEEYLWPVIKDKYANAGKMDNYFWQDFWAAKKIITKGVKEHYDIGSRIDGFIAHLLVSGIKVNQIDIRPFPSEVECLATIVDDATKLNHFEDDSIDSFSALCSLEHFGLGRYGDEINPEACFQVFENIQRKMSVGGNLYISLPIGKERVEFNAHRVFYAQTIIDAFQTMKLVEFSCAAEGKIEKDVPVHKYDNDLHNGEYRYGLFHFEK